MARKAKTAKKMRPADGEDDKLWTVTDLAKFLRTTRGGAYWASRHHGIPRVMVGSRLRFLPSEVKRWARDRVEKGA